MNENNENYISFSSLSSELKPSEKIANQLEEFLIAGNYDMAKLILEPSQPVDIAEAIGNLPQILQIQITLLMQQHLR